MSLVAYGQHHGALKAHQLEPTSVIGASGHVFNNAILLEIANKLL